MALIYFDSSALVKLLVQEEGSDLAAELWDGCDAALASRLAYPEVCAAWPQPAGTTTSARVTSIWLNRRGSNIGPRYAESNSPQLSNAMQGT